MPESTKPLSNTTIYREMMREWNKQPKDVDKIGQLVTQLKVGLSDAILLQLTGRKAPRQEAAMSRDVLEVGAQMCIHNRDLKGFQRHFDQLKLFYYDWQQDLPESAYQRQLIGLYLLSLLAENRLSDFHCEMELLPAEWLEKDVYISHSVKLERYLMEGSYNKIFQAQGNLPADGFPYLVDMMIDTVRKEIATGICRACPAISLSETSRMLFFSDKQLAVDFTKRLGWKLSPDGKFRFRTNAAASRDGEIIIADDDGAASTAGAASYDSIRNTFLSYGRSIEEIV